MHMLVLTEGLWRDGRQETDESSKAHEPAILVYLTVNKKKPVSNKVKEKGPPLSLFSEHRQALACIHLYPHMNTCTHAHTETEAGGPLFSDFHKCLFLEHHLPGDLRTGLSSAIFAKLTGQ